MRKTILLLSLFTGAGTLVLAIVSMLAMTMMGFLPISTVAKLSAASVYQQQSGVCPADRPCITALYQQGHTIFIQWSGSYDGFNILWSRPGYQGQFHVDGTSSSLTQVYPYMTYTFSVEGCDTHFLAPSTCSPWSYSEQITTQGSSADVCLQGFVWREAGPQDYVCVTPNVRSQAAYDNSQASARRNPNGGPYGLDTCLQGYVWRGAFANDHVCVTPDIRTQAAYDNSQAVYRVVH
jgi:hypothetical protein